MICFSIRDIHGHESTIWGTDFQTLREVVSRYGQGYEITISGTPQELLSLGRELAQMPVSAQVKDSHFIPYHHELCVQIIGPHKNPAVRRLLGMAGEEEPRYKTYFVQDESRLYRLKLDNPRRAYALYDIVSEDVDAYLFCVDISNPEHFNATYANAKYIREAGGASGFVYQLIISKETENLIPDVDKEIAELEAYCRQKNIHVNHIDGSLTDKYIQDTLENMQKNIVKTKRVNFEKYTNPGYQASSLNLPVCRVTRSKTTNHILLTQLSEQDRLEVILHQLEEEACGKGSKVSCTFTMTQLKQFITLLPLSPPSSPSLMGVSGSLPVLLSSSNLIDNPSPSPGSSSSPSLISKPSPSPAPPLSYSPPLSSSSSVESGVPTGAQRSPSASSLSTGFGSFWSDEDGSPSSLASFLAPGLGWW